MAAVFTPTINPPKESTALALSLLANTPSAEASTSTAHLTAHLRAANRSALSALDGTKRKVKEAKNEVERLEGAKELLRREREAVALQTLTEEYEPIHKQAELLPIEDFEAYASDDLKSSLPDSSDPNYSQALILARLRFELEQVKQREEEYQALQRTLQAVKGDVAQLKTKAIQTDMGLEQLAKAAAAIDAGLKSMFPASPPPEPVSESEVLDPTERGIEAEGVRVVVTEDGEGEAEEEGEGDADGEDEEEGESVARGEEGMDTA